MFKHNSVGRLGLFLSILVLTNACAVGEIGDSASEPRLGVGFSDAPLTCPGVSADVSASDGWQSKESSRPAPDALYFEFMARPAEANLDALVAVGAQDIHDLSDAAITVRFSETGLVDVMDDSEYSSDGSFEYDPGVWYNIAISADVTARTYDVEIGRCGEKRRTIRRGARFRADANVYDWLSNWGVWSSQRAALDLSTPTWMTSGACAPATCQALGAECGQPSDGCNGTLNCGVCGGGQLCSSGACVEEPESVPPPPSCTPANCQSLGAECGGPSDGCGGTLNCGGCGAGQLCSNNVCVDQPVTPPPPPPACVPTTCQALGAECGVRSDGCGGILNCGGCGAGQLCSSSLCIDQPVTPPPPPACVPDTCQALGAECGAWSDGCGGTLNCGGCGGAEVCSGSLCVDATPAPPPAGSGWPDADSTGLYLADGSTLRGQCVSLCSGGVSSQGGFTTSSNGQTIQCTKISGGDVTIAHSNVTLRCAEIRYGGITGLYVDGNISNTVIEDVKIDMLGGACQNEALRLWNGPSNTTMSRLEITRMQDGIKIDLADTFTIEDSWLHNMDAPGGGCDNHWDGLEMDGEASNGTITGNVIINDYGDTSAVMIDNYFGTNSNIEVDGNRLIGGGYTVYCDGQFGGGSLNNIRYTNNRFGSGYWGYTSFQNCDVTFTGNVDDRTGDAIR